MSEKTFPQGFLWGTATAAHQVEGNNTNSDWWMWEQSKNYHNNSTQGVEERQWPLEPSGAACESYTRYEEDFDLAANMNNNAIRFSVEWARIEPEEGRFDQVQIDHYKEMIAAARKRGLKTFVTLHHFTSPIWFARRGGWHTPSNLKFFSRYAKKCAEEFGDSIDFYMTINEPQVYMMMGYLVGTWPPCKKNPFLTGVIHFNFIIAHRMAYDAIKSVNKNFKVGIVKQIVWRQASPYSKGILAPLDNLLAKFLYYLNCGFFLDFLGKKNDFIGLNHYFTEFWLNLKQKNLDDKNSDMGWWIYPRGLKEVLLTLRKYNVPVYVTENGLADAKDEKRKDFLHDMLNACYEAIQEGVNLKGYFYWSLIDNYEWHQGFWPRFGLVEIDRENNFKRIPRESSKYYAKISKNNQLD